ncbi:MAG TPA: GRP family sugar transporter, partial [Bryobacteraceae bacterium]|nr:GRP family sugar transporter [Bryobacteraceae bacterium]
MILPGSYLSSIILLILSMVCWGSWANTFKVTGGKWRFELYYFDYAIGVFIAAVIAAFTFGSLGLDGFGVIDEFALSGKRQLAYAFTGGVIFNLANMLLVAAISVAGMAVAFPVGIGLALVIGVVLSYIIHPVGNVLLLTAGCGAIVAAIVVDAVAWGKYAASRAEIALQQAAPTGKTKSKKKKASSRTGLILAIVGGVLMGCFYPLVEMAKQGENGSGPYTIGLLFSVGVLLSTGVFNMFFMNLPVQGSPLGLSQYTRGRKQFHLLGILGGIIWCIGAISNFVAARAEGPAQVGPAVSYAMGQGATLISTLWGLIVWKEFEGADSNVRMLITVMLILFVAGLAAVSLAPIYGAR